MRTMKVESINLAQKKTINHSGNLVETGIFKKPTYKSVDITKLGLDRDVIADTEVHGGADQAVYLYSQTDYEWWTNELGKPMAPGTFGENLTISDFTTETLLIGDRLSINNVLLEISAPRTPCYKLSTRMGNPEFLKTFIKAVKPGAYARVLNEGKVNIGDVVTLIKTEFDYASINDVFVEWHSNNRSKEILRKALDSPISKYHKNMIQKWYKGVEAD